MNRNTTEVPVALFVFNRYKQLAKTLDCLRANNNISKLYVFADGPRNKEDENNIKMVRHLIDQVTWTQVEKIYQKKNRGLSQSIQDGLDEIFKKHESAIVIEDDVCVAPQFYSFMTTCLNQYEADLRIAGITGLRYPFSRKNLKSDPYDVFITPRFSSWGWGSWKRQWDILSFNGEGLIKKLRSGDVKLDAGGSDLPNAIKAIESGDLSGYWDVSFYMNMLLKGQYFVWPKQNYVINSGITQGSHASGAPEPPWKLKWENGGHADSELNLPIKLIQNDRILRDFLEFFEPSNLIGVSLKQQMENKLKKIKLR